LPARTTSTLASQDTIASGRALAELSPRGMPPALEISWIASNAALCRAMLVPACAPPKAYIAPMMIALSSR
jgi:hypothetical protein